MLNNFFWFWFFIYIWFRVVWYDYFWYICTFDFIISLMLRTFGSKRVSTMLCNVRGRLCVRLATRMFAKSIAMKLRYESCRKTFSLSLLINVIDCVFVVWYICNNCVWIVEQFENAAQHRIGVQSGAFPFTQTIETPRVDACECLLWSVALILSLLLSCVYAAQLGLLHAVSRRPARVSTRTASVCAQQISQTQATRRSRTQYVRSCWFYT